MFTLDTGLLTLVIGLLLKALVSLNNLENRTIKTETKLEYLEKDVVKLAREFQFEYQKRKDD